MHQISSGSLLAPWSLLSAVWLAAPLASAQPAPGGEAPTSAPVAATEPAVAEPAPLVAPAPPPPTGKPAQDATAKDAEGHPPGKKGKKHRRGGDAAVGGVADDTFAFGSAGGTMMFKGRVFARSELSHRTETVVSSSGGLEERDRNALDLSLSSARFGIEYESPLRWLSVTLELDVAGNPEVKDAFVQVGKRFFVRGGQFKIPSAALELESPWTLPLVRRGFVHDLQTDWLDVAGRRPGFAVGYRGKGGLKPRFTLGAFQGTTLDKVEPGDRDVELLEEVALDSQTLAARAELSVLGVNLGAWYEHRVGSTFAGDFDHYETAGLDATVDQDFAGGGLRLWLDGTLGESLYVADDKPDDDPTPLFASARALVGYRFGGLGLGDPYIEPFGYFALLDPDLDVVSDFATEAALGVNVGYWDRARVTLQGEMTNGQRNLPDDFLGNQEPDRLSLLLQLGARF